MVYDIYPDNIWSWNICPGKTFWTKIYYISIFILNQHFLHSIYFWQDISEPTFIVTHFLWLIFLDKYNLLIFFIHLFLITFFGSKFLFEQFICGPTFMIIYFNSELFYTTCVLAQLTPRLTPRVSQHLQKLSSLKDCLPSKAVLHQRLSSIKSCPPSKVVFHQRSSSVKVRSPCQRASSVKCCLQS